MKHYLCVVIYKENKEAIREDFEQPDISPEEFDASKHMGMIVSFPPVGKPVTKGVRVWQYCTPESKEEEELLVSMGKWMSEGIPI